ncbi:MAG: NAD-dependent epimerase/dehydratase family protein [Ilumatobacteraceae bacterium]|nr:NAD-dependent epimerase/dehydratase family protein [Ilumatobacteraceae bacterium]
MRAVVTGAAGFIGSTLAARLLDDGWSVRGIDSFTDYYDPAAKRRNVAPLLTRAGFELVEGDLAVIPAVPLIDGADVLFHQAAQPGVRSSWADGFAIYDEANIRVTQRLLEAARQTALQRLVFASSSSVYGNPTRVPTLETEPLHPFSPYGVTKLAGEHLCRAYADNFDLPVTILRYFTVYGPQQRPDMATYRLIEAARRGTPFPLYGDGSQVRDFTYVDDIAAANVLAGQASLTHGEVLNVAGGSSTRLRDLVEMVGAAVGAEVDIDWQAAQAGDVQQTGGDVRKAAEMLGWAPRVSLAAGIERQVEWHLANLP